MRRTFLLFILFYSAITAFAQDATLIYKNTVNSTVTIETDDALGSGFFVAANIIATNYHVIRGDTEAYCYTNNSDTKYRIEGYVAVDTSADLILLKVSGLRRTPIRIATIPTEIGQKVYVIGSPKGLPTTISDGIVSAIRDFDGYKLIQITAPISHGSSGGPVLNSNGELIGISVASLKEGQNLNFAIPKANLKALMNNKRTYPLSLAILNLPELSDRMHDRGVPIDTGFTNKAEAKNEMRNGVKEGKWVEYVDSSFNTISDTNAPYYSLEIYKEGEVCGIYHAYYKSGKIRTEVPFTNGKKNGLLKEYYEGGELMSETPFIDDKENGVAKEYYENGELRTIMPYTYGDENGVGKFYYENGNLHFEIPFTNNKINGIVKKYYKSGNLESETTYIDGKEGLTINYDENGNEFK
jgi:antitoxin component YwqK of YwqJK toxin-antitoxin module